jgi:hypothetical protein
MKNLGERQQMYNASGAPICGVLLISTACGAGDREGELLRAFDHDGADVAIVDNGRLDPEGSLLADPTQILQIGAAEGSEEYQLFRVNDLKRLSDGAIAIVNRGTRELRIHESDGTHRATAGGAGQGPREFRDPGGLVILSGDTIQIRDGLDRVYFTAQGTFVRRETGDAQAFAEFRDAAGGLAEMGSAIWMADGSLYAPVVYPPPASALASSTPFRPRLIFLRISANLASVDTLGEFSGTLGQFVAAGSDVSFVTPPYSPQTFLALGSADGTIIIGDNSTPQLHRFHANGTHSIVRWTAEAERVTGADVEAWKDRQRSTGGGGPEFERVWSAMDVPDTKPFYGSVSAGSDGSLWVRISADSADPTRLMMFDSNGRYAGTMDFPGRFEVHDAGSGWVLGVMRDSTDVEFVQMYEVGPGSEVTPSTG